MAELVEYTLVVVVSALFMVGSVTVYGDFASFQSGLSLRAEFDAVSALASKAAEYGTARGMMSVPPSTIACQGGTLTVAVGSASMNESLPLRCRFALTFTGGVHTLEFRDDPSGLSLEAT